MCEILFQDSNLSEPGQKYPHMSKSVLGVFQFLLFTSLHTFMQFRFALYVFLLHTVCKPPHKNFNVLVIVEISLIGHDIFVVNYIGNVLILTQC